MSMRRLRFLSMPLAVAALVALVAACSSSGSGGANNSATFTTIGYTTVLTPGAPMNPFNATNNVFPTFDAMQLGWSDATVANPNQEIPGLAASWSVRPAASAKPVSTGPGHSVVTLTPVPRSSARSARP